MNRSSEFDLPLALLREAVAASDLLPPAYVQYRPLLADGLCFFLRRLPPVRLRRIFSEQSSLPGSISMSERIVALLHHIPTLHKLGQVLARDHRLLPAFRAQLQRLESLEPRSPLAVFRRELAREFPRWRRAGIELAPQALAEGSVAMVIRFSLENFARSASHASEAKKNDQILSQGVFKLLKPGIEKLLDEDLEIWARLGEYLDEECERYHLPSLDYRETFETVRDLLTHEIRLDEEQAHLAEAAREYADLDSIRIPELFPFCSPRLTAMDYLPGEPLTRALAADGASEARLAPLVAEALVARPIFSSAGSALFHADPHAGNLLVTPEGRLGILDWSLVGRLQKADRVEIVQLLLGAMTLDATRMENAIKNVSRNIIDSSALKIEVQRGMRELRQGQFPGIVWLTRLLDGIVLRARARLRPNLLLFRKSLLTLEGVLADLTRSDALAGSRYLDSALAARFARQFVVEWPDRFWQLPDSRIFNTHLSSGDLLELLWAAPATLTRFWAATWMDFLARAKT